MQTVCHTKNKMLKVYKSYTLKERKTMSYSVEDLNPALPVLIIDGKEITISFVTLHLEVIFKEKYGSLDKVFKAISDDPTEILNIIWILVTDKKEFSFSFEVFKKFALTSKGSIADWSREMMTCLQQSVYKSMPLIKNTKRHNDIQKIKGTQTDEKPCYGVYFDTVSKRYGYTIDQFYALTLRQLHILLKVINDKSYEELEVQAALAGKQLKPRMKFEDVSEEEEKENDEQAIEALKRLQEEYKSRNEDGK